MIANVAFLAAITTFLAVAWLAGELSFLAPYKAGIFRHHGLTTELAILVLFMCVMVPLGSLIFMRVERRCQTLGTLSQH